MSKKNHALKSKLKKGDLVIILNGKSKGHKGKIIEIKPQEKKCKVEGGFLIQKVKREEGKKAQFIKQEAFIDISNVAFYDEEQSKAVKLGYLLDDKDGKKRIIKSTKRVV